MYALRLCPKNLRNTYTHYYNNLKKMLSNFFRDPNLMPLATCDPSIAPRCSWDLVQTYHGVQGFVSSASSPLSLLQASPRWSQSELPPCWTPLNILAQPPAATWPASSQARGSSPEGQPQARRGPRSLFPAPRTLFPTTWKGVMAVVVLTEWGCFIRVAGKRGSQRRCFTRGAS